MTSSILPHVCGTNPAKGLFTRLIAQSEPVKTCQKCGESKAVALFSKNPKNKDGLRGQCKACVAEYNAAYRAANPDRVRETSADWNSANQERKRATDAAWLAANKDRKRATGAAYYAANKDRVRETNAAWKAENPERARELTAAWHAANPERMREYYAARYAANPERARIASHTRRARKRQNGGTLSRGITANLLKLQKGKCACCHADLGETGYHVDHVVPLALGGQNTDYNVQLLCPSCNCSKGAKNPVDFMQSRGFLL